MNNIIVSVDKNIEQLKGFVLYERYVPVNGKINNLVVILDNVDDVNNCKKIIRNIKCNKLFIVARNDLVEIISKKLYYDDNNIFIFNDSYTLTKCYKKVLKYKNPDHEYYRIVFKCIIMYALLGILFISFIDYTEYRINLILDQKIKIIENIAMRIMKI